MIFVTGGTGLLGSHLLMKLAERGEKIKALKRPGSDLIAVSNLFSFYHPSNKAAEMMQCITWVDGDLTDPEGLPECMAGCDAVFHCAALVSYHQKDKEALFSINSEGTSNMVNAALQCGIKRFNYVSSIAALGRTPDGKIIDENARWKNSPENSNYAVSKFLAENEVWRGAEEGLEVLIINPGIIIGPGDPDRSSSSLFKTVWKGLPRTAPGRTGMVGVLDTAEGFLSLADAGIINQRFVMVSDNLRFHDFVTQMADVLKAKKPGRPAPKWMMRIAWLFSSFVSFLTGQRSAITRETIRSAYNESVFDGSKITTAISFSYRPLAKAMQDGAMYFHQNN